MKYATVSFYVLCLSLNSKIYFPPSYFIMENYLMTNLHVNKFDDVVNQPLKYKRLFSPLSLSQ